MATAFMGYVLPFGQMSFWGATVITNLLSPFPSLIEWVSGGHYVYNPTLKRFFLFHFLFCLMLLQSWIINLVFIICILQKQEFISLLDLYRWNLLASAGSTVDDERWVTRVIQTSISTSQ